jgi:hypothetical protein
LQRKEGGCDTLRHKKYLDIAIKGKRLPILQGVKYLDDAIQGRRLPISQGENDYDDVVKEWKVPFVARKINSFRCKKGALSQRQKVSWDAICREKGKISVICRGDENLVEM